MVSAALPLFVLHSGQAFLARLTRAVTPQYALHRVESWSTLRAHLQEAPQSAGALVDPYGAGNSTHLSTELHTLLQDFPSVTVVAVLEVLPGRGNDLCTLGRWGVGGIIDLQTDATPEAVRRCLHRAGENSLRGAVERKLVSRLGAEGAPVLRAAVEVALSGGNAGKLACALRVSPRTLDRRCSAVDLPPPRRLLLWMRVLLATQLFGESGRTLDGVAYGCGYSSTQAFRRAVQSLLGVQLPRLRDTDAFAAVSAAFLAEVEQYRAKGRDGMLSRQQPG
jgi:AraC-like DNA-binding protein